MQTQLEQLDREDFVNISLEEKIKRAIILLKENEPKEGYYLAFSGGKDSCTIKELAILSGVKFDAWYNNTTIDPPELVRFIKEYHKDVKWNFPKENMFKRIATRKGMPQHNQCGGVAPNTKKRGAWKNKNFWS